MGADRVAALAPDFVAAVVARDVVPTRFAGFADSLRAGAPIALLTVLRTAGLPAPEEPLPWLLPELEAEPADRLTARPAPRPADEDDDERRDEDAPEADVRGDIVTNQDNKRVL